MVDVYVGSGFGIGMIIIIMFGELRTDTGYHRDAGVPLLTLANPGTSLRFYNH